jgi:ABC-2 type transport system ATP-binding protein
LQNDYAIQTINLTKTFKIKTPNSNSIKRKNETIKAIDNLNLNIKKGEILGLLGPNGAGKTTLIKMLCTLLPPDQGTAQINGYDVIKQQMQVKQSLGTLFSVGDRGFFWRLSGYQNLEFFATIYNVPKKMRQERIQEVLRLVDLTSSASNSIQKYSGGMKRKLALARALIADPPILLLDEPTVALDVISSRNIRDFVTSTVKETGKTVLYTTHYIEEAAQICDRIAILQQGKLIAIDKPSNLIGKIKKNECIELTLENIDPQKIEQLHTQQGVLNVIEQANETDLPNQKALILTLTTIDHLPSIFDFIFKQNIKLINFKLQEPTLEDAFIELTKKEQL